MLHVAYGKVYYWTDKYSNEIDFIIKGTEKEVHTVECKINNEKYSPSAVEKFREYYPEGNNYCYSPYIDKPYKLKFGKIEVSFQSFPL